MLLLAQLNARVQPGIALLDLPGCAGIDHAGILLRRAGIGTITELRIRLGWNAPGQQQAAGQHRHDRQFFHGISPENNFPRAILA